MGLDLNDVGVFVAVVRESGFTAAGRALGLPASTVSRRVSRLEEELGFRLLHRTTRQLGLTEAGRHFYDRTARMEQWIADAAREAAGIHEVPGGVLRVTAPPDEGGILWDLFSGFAQAHPRVDLDLRFTLDKVDLIEGGIDVALRGGPAPDSPLLTAQRLVDSRVLLAASPRYLSARGTPQRVEDLAEHDGVCLDPWAPNGIRRLDGDRGFVRLHVRSRIRANSLDCAQRAAVDGLGIAPLLELTCRRALEQGTLVEVLRGALPDTAPMWVISRAGKQRSAAASALVRHVVTATEGWRSAGTTRSAQAPR